MQYSVIWHDCEDDRTGESFEVDGPDPVDAYFKAVAYIKGLSSYLEKHFCSIDIECLVNENGTYHHPDIFLKDEQE